MKPFSKKAQEGQGLCNYCGKWKPTDLTPEQLEAIDWKCADCAAQRGQAPDEQKAIERGQKEISKYDNEYQFLVKLVKLIVAEGVPPQEIKAIAEAYPFVTIDDVGDLTAKIWTLATEKYQIPREWLINKLPKNASLKHADLWPAQEQAQDMLSHTHNSLSYNNDQEPDTSVSGPRPDEVGKQAESLNIDQIVKILNSKDTNRVVRIDTKNLSLELSDGTEISFDDAAKKAMDMSKEGVFSGSEFSNTEFNVNPTLDNGPFSSPQDQGATPQKKPFPNTMWDAATDDEDESQPASNVASSLNRPFSKKALLKETVLQYGDKFWIAPNNQIYATMGSTHEEWAEENKLLLKNHYNYKDIDQAFQHETIWTFLIEKGWYRIYVEPFAINVEGDIPLPSFVRDFLWNNWDEEKSNFHVNISDLSGKTLTIDEPDKLHHSRRANLNKVANLPSKFWIAPDGKEFPMGGVHGHWIENNLKKLKQYGIDAKGKNLTQIWNEMTETGWARVSNEPAGTRFVIEVNDLSNLPPYLDNFIAKYYTQGEEITLGNGKGQYVKVNDPFPSIQKAVNKELTNPINASLKQAAISGTITNKILQAIHNNGGTTYNLTNGDMVGTPNFSVSVYPERERIVDGVDFDILEGFIDDNEDLLKDPANSLGAWTTDGKIYLDVVVTIPDQERAIDLAKQNNQIAIWDLQNGREISTGGTGGGQMPKAFSKKNLIKIADIGEWGGYWIGPNDKVYEMGENDEHWDWAYEEGIARIGEDPIKKGWVRARINETELIFQVNDLKNIPSTVDTFIAQHNGEVIQIDDYQKQRAEVEYTDALEHGIQKAVNKALIQTIKTSKTAEESLLSQDAQNQIASKSSPAYVIAVNNFAESVKRGHSKDRSLEYAIESVKNLEKIDPKKLVEFINEYVVI